VEGGITQRENAHDVMIKKEVEGPEMETQFSMWEIKQLM
jgi:hypothetical protein